MFLAYLVLSEKGIYVSRLTGHDTKTCGKVGSPCRTIFYGIQQLSTGLYVYLDGANTLNNPYTCEVLDPGHPGIYLSKSVSFVGIKSRAHISCLHGNYWLVNGTKHKHGIQIGFSGLAFLNTSVQLFDALVAVNDTIFANTKHLSLYIRTRKLRRLSLSFNNVVFEKNTASIRIEPKTSKVFLNITNTVFRQNGNPSANLSSILWINSSYTSIDIQIRNCSFIRNTFMEYGMLSAENKFGVTTVLLRQIRLEENRQLNPSTKRYNGLFRFKSEKLFLRLEQGIIYKTSATLLYVADLQLAEINILNVYVDEFYSGSPGGGVMNLIRTDLCYLLIKDSSFRNGKNYMRGAILFISGKIAVLTIKNSTIHNVSSTNSGGAIHIESDPKHYPQSWNHNRNFFVSLHILNSSFSHSSSGMNGGAIIVFAQKLSVIIRGSSFLHCNATLSGGALGFQTNDTSTICINNSYFLKNSAYDGAIVHSSFLGRHKDLTFNVSIINVTFEENMLYSQNKFLGVVFVRAESKKMTVDFRNTYFNRNFAGQCSSVFIRFHGLSKLRFVTFDNCTFRKNVGFLGTVVVGGWTSLTCKNSIFDSNGPATCMNGVKTLKIVTNDSVVLIMNTTFVNNLCPTVKAQMGGASSLTISDSAFIRNKNVDAAGGTLEIGPDTPQLSNLCNGRITRVLFQENIARVGSVLSLGYAEVVFTNCSFLNNFALFHGGQIMCSGCGSVKLSLVHSVFKQTINKIVTRSSKLFVATSFVRLFSPDKLTIINTTFDQRAISKDPAIFVPAAKNISIDNASLSSCPMGHNIEKTSYGYTDTYDSILIGLSLSCKECDYNFYSLQRGTARGLNIDDSFQCLPCPRGADCVPTIQSKTNYWGYHVSLNPPKLAFTICPFGYCKSPATKSTEYNACQGKRSGVMCGMCSQGYTEALSSTYCTPVKECNDHWFWIFFLVYVFSMAIILVFKPPFVTYCLKQIFWFKNDSRTVNTQAYEDFVPSFSLDDETPEENISLSSTEQHKHDKRQFSRFEEIIFYFYQIAQLLLSSSSLKEFFDSQFIQPALSFFNFQPSFTQQYFICPFPGLTPQTKLVFKNAPVFGTLIAIFFIYSVHSIICRTRGSVRPAIAPYFQASIKTVFLGYVTMATVSISLIRCVFVADESRWFYNGNITCWQWWQYASITFIAVFVIPFIFVLAVVSFKVYRDKITVRQFLLAIIFPLPFLILWLLGLACSPDVVNVEENQNLNALKEMLLAPYRQPDDESKRGAIYWQSVLIARRFILVLIFCIVTEPSIRLFCMTIVCVFVFGCHLKLRPFQNSSANNLESVSLFSLIVLGLVNLFKSVFFGSERNIKGSLIIVLKVFQWLETVMLGLFPAILLLLLSFAVVSFSLRVLFMCCRSIFKFLFRPCAHRWMSRDFIPLLNVCNNIEDDLQEHIHELILTEQ